MAVICKNCGGEIKGNETFCFPCRAAVKPETVPAWACSGCGKEYPAGTKFCSECGGRIEEKKQEPELQRIFSGAFYCNMTSERRQVNPAKNDFSRFF